MVLFSKKRTCQVRLCISRCTHVFEGAPGLSIRRTWAKKKRACKSAHRASGFPPAISRICRRTCGEGKRALQAHLWPSGAGLKAHRRTCVTYNTHTSGYKQNYVCNCKEINARTAGRPALTHHPHPHHPMCTPGASQVPGRYRLAGCSRSHCSFYSSASSPSLAAAI